ncbi:MAG: pitrilysin family protein [Patescibacteria group bacterium]
MYKLKKFSSGLTLVTAPVQGIETVTVMALFGAGSKCEQRKNRGVSHFLEHMMFKGTRRRPSAKAMAEVMDKVGGEYNAFTGKEYTGYWAKVGSGHLDLALDWLSDLVINAKLEADKMEKERGVIIEEINMYKDTPTQRIEDVFENLVYGDQPSGWDIIGTKKTIKAMPQSELLGYKRKNYTLGNCVVCVSGKPGKGLEDKVEKYFCGLFRTKAMPGAKTREKQSKPKFKAEFKKTDQSHCMIGFRTVNLFSKERYALGIITAILGGSMSSRLFLEVREKLGLAYYVHADSHLYTDSGYLSVQAGVRNVKFEQAMKAILDEFSRLKSEKTGEAELKKAKENIKGQTLISLESSNSRAFFFGSQQLLKKKIESLEQRFEALDRVTAGDIQETARRFFAPERLNAALIGPKRRNKKIDEILNGFKKD